MQAAANSYGIKVGFNSSATIALATGSTSWGAVYSGGSATISGFTPGKNAFDDNLNYNYFTEKPSITEAGSGQQTQGTSLNFSSNINVIRLGSVGGGSAAETAAALNKVYSLAGQTGEALEILGQTSAGDTVIYDFGTKFGSPDSNGNHLVDASELIYQAMLAGVHTGALTVRDLAL